MKVLVNGTLRDVDDAATVDDVVRLLTVHDTRGVAVARNGDIVLRSAWTTTQVVNGDRIEVLQAVQGG